MDDEDVEEEQGEEEEGSYEEQEEEEEQGEEEEGDHEEQEEAEKKEADYEEQEEGEKKEAAYEKQEEKEEVYNEDEADYEAAQEGVVSEVDPAESAKVEHEGKFIVIDGPQRREPATVASVRGLRTSYERVKVFVQDYSTNLTRNTIGQVAAVVGDPCIDVAAQCKDGRAVHVAFYTSCFKRWWQMKDALMANLLLCLADSGRCSFNVAIWEEDPDCENMLRFLNFYCGDLNVQMCVCLLSYLRSVSVLSACAVAC